MENLSFHFVVMETTKTNKSWNKPETMVFIYKFPYGWWRNNKCNQTGVVNDDDVSPHNIFYAFGFTTIISF